MEAGCCWRWSLELNEPFWGQLRGCVGSWGQRAPEEGLGVRNVKGLVDRLTCKRLWALRSEDSIDPEDVRCLSTVKW